MEECGGGWLVACLQSNTVEVVQGGGVSAKGEGAVLGGPGCGGGQFHGPSALALVPGLGLVVRESLNQRLQVFVDPDALAMAGMSAPRVVWLVAVARAITRADRHVESG